MKKLKIFIGLIFGLGLLAGCQFTNNVEKEQDTVSILDILTQDPKGPVKEFNLTAKETNWKLNDPASISAWTYNGTVPGEEIRVTECDVIKVKLKNELPEPVTSLRVF
jgi:FtsP/CotA-like multicopper oxidase with cupredoxin domain